uniref:SUEL-type lectin domain-containing protein n=1 Tax=Glossina brevipalpis TaxID=37001 RepID=A0A1A9X1S4_9MUSC
MISTSENGGNEGIGVVHSGTQIEVKPPESCTVSGLQYALLQTVVDACQKKRHCKFSANSKPVAIGDLCAGIRKFVEIAYKCRPYEFRSKVACENESMPLMCNPYSRIAVYSASFGYIERESVQCTHNSTTQNTPTTTNNKHTCLVSYATETVMQICHGRRRCSVIADAGTFGKPCKNDIPMSLKVVYTCIPRKVLKDRYETAPEMDEPQQSELDMDQDELYDEDQFYKESEAIPPAPKLQGAIPNDAYPFDFNMHSRETTTALIPSILSHNDSSLQGAGGAGNLPDFNNKNTIFRNLSKVLRANELDFYTSTKATSTLPLTESSSFSSTLVTTNNTWRRDDIDDDKTFVTLPNFIYRKRCQTEDDWGTIGLNCTDDDIVNERVVVIGFLINWIKAYIHIRQHQEQFYLYLIITVATGMLLCMTLVIGRLTLQRRRSCRKSSLSSETNNEKTIRDTMGGNSSDKDGKHQQEPTADAQLNGSFVDNISDIDAEIDLRSPMAVSSLPSRNEPYMTYAPIPSCTYDSLGGHHTSAHYGTATTMLMPSTSQHDNLILPGSYTVNNAKVLSCSAAAGSRQSTPPTPSSLYTSIGVCSPSVSGPIGTGPHTLTTSVLSSVANESMGAPSYLCGTLMVPGHHHSRVGTLRRNLLPTSMMGDSSLPLVSGPTIPNSIVGVPTSSNIYYDSTIPRHFVRGVASDNSSYFYG